MSQSFISSQIHMKHLALYYAICLIALFFSCKATRHDSPNQNVPTPNDNTTDSNLYLRDSIYWNDRIYFKIKNDAQIEITDLKRIESDSRLQALKAVFSRNKVYKIERPFPTAKSADLKNTYRIYFDERVGKIDLLIKDLQAIGYIDYAEKMPVMRTFVAPVYPDDPDNLNCQPVYAAGCLQYALPLINAYAAFGDYTQFSYPKVDIAIVDNAVKRTHPDLMPNIVLVPGCNVTNGGNDPNPPNGSFDHGTHCAGIAGAATYNNLGIASIGYNNRIMPVRASLSPLYLTHGYDGIAFAVDHGAEIISCSWGGTESSITDQNVIDYAYSSGVIIVAAAGNSNVNFPVYPAAYDHVISVASTDQNDHLSTFSNFGNWIDVCAPGTNIWSTSLANNGADTYEYKSGTSMACPLVAGLAGLLKSKNPTFSPDQIESCIKSSAENIDAVNPTFAGLLGAGRINAYAALMCSGTCSSPITLSAISAIPSGQNYYPGDQVVFSAAATNASGLKWTVRKNSTVVHTATANTLTYTFLTPGVYDVCVAAENSDAYCSQENCFKAIVMEGNDLTFEKKATYEKIGDIIEAKNGGYIVASVRYFAQDGKVVQKLDKQGNILWKHRIASFPAPALATFSNMEKGYFSIAEDDDESVVMAIPTYSAGQHYLSLVKLDGLSGTIVWKKEIHPPATWSFALPFFIKKDYSGGFIIAGSGHAYKDFFMVKIDGAGNILWSRFYDTGGHFVIKGFTQAFDNGFLVFGINNSWTGITYEYAAVRLNNNGTVQWSNLYRPLGYFELYDEEFTGIIDAVEIDDCSFMLAARTCGYPPPGTIVSTSHLFTIGKNGSVLSAKEMPNLTALGLASGSNGSYKMITSVQSRGAFYAIEFDASANVVNVGKLESPSNFHVVLNMPESNFFKGEKVLCTQDNGLILCTNSGILPTTNDALVKLSANSLSSCADFPNGILTVSKSYFSTPATTTLLTLPVTENIPASSLQAVNSSLINVCNFASNCSNNTSFFMKRTVANINEPLEIVNTSTIDNNSFGTFHWVVDGVAQSMPPTSFSTPGVHSVKLNYFIDNPSCNFTLERKVFISGYPACNDGDPCTVNDTYDAACNCLGTFQDTDADGVCDAQDKCPGFNDAADADSDGVPDGCDFCAATNPFAIQNQICYGGTKSDFPGTISKVTGGYLISAKTNSPSVATNFNIKGPNDAWVVKTDDNGTIQWSKTFGNICDDNSLNTPDRNIEEMTDGYVLAGNGYGICGVVGANEDFWLLKTDLSGNFLWERFFGGSYADNCNVMVKSATGFLMAGSTYSVDGDATGNHGGVDALVINVDQTGNIVWKSCFGGTGLDAFTSAQTTTDGYLLWGYTTSNDGDVAGNHGGQDFWLVKLDWNGVLVWQKCIGGSGSEVSAVVRMAPNGDCFVLGTTGSVNGDIAGQHGSQDFWVGRLDAFGNLIWSKCYGGTGVDSGRDLLVAPGGSTIVMTGTSTSHDNDVSNSHPGSYDVWVASADANTGQIFCNNSYGGWSYEEGKSILYNPVDGSYLLLCQSNSPDAAVSCHHGWVDIWLLKVD